MDKLQANTTHIATALCIDGKKLWRWYRDVLSGFMEETSQEKLHRYDFDVTIAGKTKTVKVPILKTENIGPNMAIDEKQIGEEMHTVLSNRDTGKIALLACTIKLGELATLIPYFEGKAIDVKTVTRDLSNCYNSFCRQAFPNAIHIADKFHIVKSLLDAQQDVRVRYRQEILREKRLKYEAFKKKEKLRKLACQQNGQAYKKNHSILKKKNSPTRKRLWKYLSEVDSCFTSTKRIGLQIRQKEQRSSLNNTHKLNRHTNWLAPLEIGTKMKTSASLLMKLTNRYRNGIKKLKSQI